VDGTGPRRANAGGDAHRDRNSSRYESPQASLRSPPVSQQSAGQAFCTHFCVTQEPMRTWSGTVKTYAPFCYNRTIRLHDLRVPARALQMAKSILTRPYIGSSSTV
jgi:hypothetical protein